MNTHVCFYQTPSWALLRSIQITKLSPSLTLAVPAVIALAAALLIDHRVAAALRAEIACGLQVTHGECGGVLRVPIFAAILSWRAGRLFWRFLGS